MREAMLNDLAVCLLGGVSGLSVFVPCLDGGRAFAVHFAVGVDDALAPPSCGCVTGGNAIGLIGDMFGVLAGSVLAYL